MAHPRPPLAETPPEQFAAAAPPFGRPSAAPAAAASDARRTPLPDKAIQGNWTQSQRFSGMRGGGRLGGVG